MLQQRPLELSLTAGVMVPKEESGGALTPRVVPVPRCDANMGAGDGDNLLSLQKECFQADVASD